MPILLTTERSVNGTQVTKTSVLSANGVTDAGFLRSWVGFGCARKKSEAVGRLRSSSIDLSATSIDDSELSGYCTVRLTVVVCVRAPDCAVTTIDAVPRFVWLLL